MKKTIGAFLMVFGLLSAGLLAFQSKLIFYPEPLPVDYDYRLPAHGSEVFVDTADGERINALWYRADNSKGVVLYFHGNAGNLGSWKDISHAIVPLGYDLFIIDYRGFGKSTGRLSEKGLYEDARASYAYLIAQGYTEADIVIYGRSIGSGVASELATTRPARALILETPFTSLVDLAKSLAPHFLPALTLRFRFDNASKLPKVDAPILLIHGDRDELIPHSHSEVLAAQLGDKAELAIIPGAGHNDIGAYPAYAQILTRFLARTAASR